jgi:hypothetical protein
VRFLNQIELQEAAARLADAAQDQPVSLGVGVGPVASTRGQLMERRLAVAERTVHWELLKKRGST